MSNQDTFNGSFINFWVVLILNEEECAAAKFVQMCKVRFVSRPYSCGVFSSRAFEVLYIQAHSAQRLGDSLVESL